MIEDSKSATVLTIGVDLGDKYSYFCVLDPSGEVVEEGRVVTTAKALEQRFRSYESSRVAIEVGTHSPWVQRLLVGLGHKVLVANSRKLRFIYENDEKSDQLDAERLARVARMDPKLLAPITHRGGSCQQDLAVLRSRDALVSARTRLINHVRGAVKSFGARLTKCSTPSFHKQAPGRIPKELAPALSPLIETIGSLTKEIKAYDKRIEAMASARYPETVLLRQVAGIGPLTSLCFVLTLEDPFRFKKSRAVGAYLGLRPRRRQSGKGDPQLRISKAGDRMLRRLLAGSAQYILGHHGPDTDLRRWGLYLASRGGKSAKKRAVVAVARKLAVLLHRLWISGEVYDPQRNAQRCNQKKAA